MSYPNVLNYTSTNKINIEDVRETCQEEQVILKNDILTAIDNVGDGTNITDVKPEPITQNITRAMGDFWFSIDGTIPPGGLPHLGHLVSREVYGDFYLWLESSKIILTDEEWLTYAESHDGCCPHYSSGDGSTTFRTPSYPDTFLKIVSDINSSGVYQSEGLPDPQLDILFRQDSTSSGVYKDVYGTDGKTGSAYSNTSGTDEWMQSASANGNTLTPFAVRAENSIYGSSDHVTPKNMSILIGVYAVGAIVPVGTTDAEKIMSGVTRVEGLLDSKVDKTSPYIIEHWSSGTEWYRVWSNGWIEQGGSIPSGGASSWRTLTFPTAFSDTNYSIVVSCSNISDITYWAASYTKTVSSVNVGTCNYIGTKSFYGVDWYAFGY